MKTIIFEQILKKDKNNNIISKFAILKNLNTDQLNKDLNKYCGETPRNIFVDIRIIDPWTRIVISNINDLKYYDLDIYKKLSERINKLEKIEKIKNNNPD